MVVDDNDIHNNSHIFEGYTLMVIKNQLQGSQKFDSTKKNHHLPAENYSLQVLAPNAHLNWLGKDSHLAEKGKGHLLPLDELSYTAYEMLHILYLIAALEPISV